jgi:hypothetical protein
MPKIPKRKTSRTPTIRTNCHRRFFFMMKTSPNVEKVLNYPITKFPNY